MVPDRQPERGCHDLQLESALALAGAVLAAVASLRSEVPPPKGQPFYGLDHEDPHLTALLPALSSQGIFRKYEFVLELGSGWGGRARWAARHFGCRVLGVEPSLAAARVAQMLGRYAGSLEEAIVCTARLEALPFQEAAFTHAWWFQPCPSAPVEGVLREAWRVLRDGGYFAWVFDVAELSVEQASAKAHEAGFAVMRCQVSMLPPLDFLWQVAQNRLDKILRMHPELKRQWKARISAEPHNREQIALLFARRRLKR